MNYTNQLLVITTLFSFLCNSIFAQSKEIKEIDSLMKHSNSIGVFNGNVLVSKNNKIIYTASFGFTDASKKDKLTNDSKFHLGSITKEFSAAALLQLEEAGKLKLSDAVSKFIQELPAWANEVTIKDVLRYTSGIPNVNWKKIKNDKDLFDGLMSVEKLNFKPGTDYDYNNNNIFLRHFIIERITGIPYKNYVEKYIFKPLKMDSSLITPLENEKNITKGFKDNLVQDAAEIPITGGTYTTTYDLMKWTQGLHSKKVVNKNSLYELGKNFNTAKSQSALGNAKFKNKKLIQHTHDGRAGSFEAFMFSDLEKKITIILLSNNYHGNVSEISEKINAILQNKK